MTTDRNCLSYWFPLLEGAGLPVPSTRVIHAPEGLLDLLDGKRPPGWEEFLNALTDACDRMGYPVFLRTGQGSGKHDWERTCYIQDASAIPDHVVNLVEWSCLVDFLGLSVDVWCVREMLPTRHLSLLPAYADMPLVREFRCFVRDGLVECIHPYWPEKAVAEGFSGFMLPAGVSPALLTQEAGSYTRDEYAHILHLAERAGRVLTGYWSVDILDTTRGWFITDCAEGDRSFHHPECVRGTRQGGEQKPTVGLVRRTE